MYGKRMSYASRYAAKTYKNRYLYDSLVILS